MFDHYSKVIDGTHVLAIDGTHVLAIDGTHVLARVPRHMQGPIMLGVCPRGYHRDDCIALYPWHIMSPLNIHYRQLVSISNYVNCL
jgi:hypothetical protein